MYIVLISSFGACVSMRQSFVAAHCSREGAFEKGLRDAEDRNELSQYVAKECPRELMADVESGYREGYDVGMKRYHSAITIVDSPVSRL